LLAKAAARGGNILMNIGRWVTANIDPKDVAILKGIGDGAGQRRMPFAGRHAHAVAGADVGESTRSANTLYFARFQLAVEWTTGGQGIEVGDKRALGCWNREAAPAKLPALRISRCESLDVSVGVPAQAPDKVDSVVVLECAGDMMTDTNRLLQPGLARIRCGRLMAHCTARAEFGARQKKRMRILELSRADEIYFVAGAIGCPASYEVAVVYDAGRRIRPAVSLRSKSAIKL